jgi:hypothetical protein
LALQSIKRIFHSVCVLKEGAGAISPGRPHKHTTSLLSSFTFDRVEKTMLSLLKTWVVMGLLVVFASGQTPSGTENRASSLASKVNQSGKSTNIGASAPDSSATSSDFEKNLSQSVIDNTTDPDDHVRCFFTVKQLVQLQPIPGVAKLTAADESGVITGLISVIRDANEGKDLSRSQKAEFVKELADGLADNLVGKTPGEALATIMDALYTITARTPAKIAEATVASAQSLGAPEFAARVAQKVNDPNASWRRAADSATASEQIAALVMEVPTELAHAKSLAASPTTEDKAAAEKTAEVARNAGGPSDLSSVVDKARSDLNKLARPEDVGCAYQILSWNDSRLLFGRSVANEYIGVQITIRNLNKKEEFIVHNAMLRVDSDINGAIGQYYEGSDKLGVEAHNNAGESLTRRGKIGNGITAAGVLLSALQPIVNITNFSNAVAAFNGGVVPGWKTMSPDHQKDQLLLIANNGFSASDNFKTVVPKSSTATFYTWFPAKPFLEGWWLQACAQDAAGVNPNHSASSPQVGVDLDWARKLCGNSPASKWEKIVYKDWSSTSDQLFRDLSYAVIAGMHIIEDSKNIASVTDMKCPKDPQGRLDLSKASSNGTFSCDVSGENLDKVTKLRLENAGNLVDPARPDGVISEVSSDNTSARVAFNTSDLNALPGDTYNVFAIGKDGTEKATGQKVNLKHDAAKFTLAKVDPSTLDLGKKPLDKLTLTGTNLDALKNICMKGPSSETKTVKVSDAKSTQATADVSSAGLTKGEWQIYAENCTDSNGGEKPPTLGVTPAKSKTRGAPPQ